MAALTLRIPDDLHALIRVAAATRGQTVHAWLLAAVRSSTLRQGAQDPTLATALDRAAAVSQRDSVVRRDKPRD